MREEVVAVFIPIVLFLVTGLVLVTHLYFRSREKQLMIDKGLSYEQMMDLLSLKSKSSGLFGLKLGVVVVFFGLGLGLGFLLRGPSYEDEWIWVSLLTMTGLGFVVAYFVGRVLKNGNTQQ